MLIRISLLGLVAYVLFRTVHKPGSTWSRIGGALGVLVGIAPAIWVMAARGVSSKLVVGYGVLFFLFSVLMKTALYLVLSKHVYSSLGPAPEALIHGPLSSACELGIAAIAFGLVLPNLGLWQVFGFGAGAAAVEAIIVSLQQNPLVGTQVGTHIADQTLKLQSGPAWLVVAVPVMDRGLATTAHIACRGLVAAGIASRRLWPGAIAFLAFAATDGFVMYCHVRKWEFAKPVLAARLFSVPALATASSVVAWYLTT